MRTIGNLERMFNSDSIPIRRKIQKGSVHAQLWLEEGGDRRTESIPVWDHSCRLLSWHEDHLRTELALPLKAVNPEGL